MLPHGGNGRMDDVAAAVVLQWCREGPRGAYMHFHVLVYLRLTSVPVGAPRSVKGSMGDGRVGGTSLCGCVRWLGVWGGGHMLNMIVRSPFWGMGRDSNPRVCIPHGLSRRRCSSGVPHSANGECTQPFLNVGTENLK